MRKLLMLVLLLALIAGAAIMLGWWQPTVSPGSLPSVSVEGGRAPEINANIPTVSLGTENKTIAVPTLEVTRPGANPPPPGATPSATATVPAQ